MFGRISRSDVNILVWIRLQLLRVLWCCQVDSLSLTRLTSTMCCMGFQCLIDLKTSTSFRGTRIFYAPDNEYKKMISLYAPSNANSPISFSPLPSPPRSTRSPPPLWPPHHSPPTISLTNQNSTSSNHKYSQVLTNELDFQVQNVSRFSPTSLWKPNRRKFVSID